ncbi:hypothetical protein H7J86_24395 [Mycobacterium hackensackense]|uniref:hypothetical protein n=1 Tax=Mycobacterium hackensackense TaxID=228909 RepID=UPI002265E1D8|nr:hypothetical protein [Mycobacterium hackensackense]MCV7255308.1 hypothetical protein [Mycobacterium hackensackense]
MTAAEVLAAAMHSELDEHGYEDDDEKRGQVAHHFAARQLAALREAGFGIIELPIVAHKGPHDTDAKFFRQVADRMETPSRVDFLSGSNVRRAVRSLLYRAADAAEASQ